MIAVRKDPPKLELNATDYLLGHWYAVNPTVSLYVVLTVSPIAIGVSVVFPAKQDRDDAGEADASARCAAPLSEAGIRG